MNYQNVESIVKRIKSGDNAAKLELIKQFKQNINSLLRRTYIHGYENEDLENECYGALFHAVKLYDPDKHRFVAYATNAIRNQLYYIGRNTISQKFRNDDTGIIFTPELEKLMVADIDIENDFIKNSTIKKVDDIILSLNNEERQMVYSLFFESKTLKQYAYENRIPYSAAFYKKNQLIKKIKRLFHFLVL